MAGESDLWCLIPECTVKYISNSNEDITGGACLHQGREEISVSKVREKSGLICARCCRESYLNSLLPYINCDPVKAYSERGELIVRCRPFLMILSKAFTNSVNITSTWSKPAKTVMTSELVLVYFLFRTPPRKTVKV